MIKRVINVLCLMAVLLVYPIVTEQIEEAYWVGYASSKVEPAKYMNKRVATTFQIKYNGEQYTMTNLHVCRIAHLDKPETLDIFLVGKYIDIGKYKRQIIAVDPVHDLCLLEPNPSLPSFDLAENDDKGELVRIIGFPRGLQKTLRKGRIFGARKSPMFWLGNHEVNYKLISTLAYGGNSGSPVINKWGNLVGVLFAGHRMFHTEAYIVPLDDVKNFLYRFAY